MDIEMTAEWIKEKIIEAHKDAVERGEYDCPECEGIGDVINPAADVESELAVNCGRHSLKKEPRINCQACKGTGKDPNKNIGELLQRINEELCLAGRAHRCGRFANWVEYDLFLEKFENKKHAFEREIKDTFEDKIADVFIRLFDLMGYLNIPMREVNAELEYKVANVGAQLLDITMRVYNIVNGKEKSLPPLLFVLNKFCQYHKIPIQKHIEAKMAYNKTRPAKHGKGY